LIVHELLNLQDGAPAQGDLSLPARGLPPGPVMEAQARSPTGLLLPLPSATPPHPISSLATPPRSAATSFDAGTILAPAPARLEPIVVPRPMSISPALGPESAGPVVAVPLGVSGHAAAVPSPAPAPAPGPQGDPSHIRDFASKIKVMGFALLMWDRCSSVTSGAVDKQPKTDRLSDRQTIKHHTRK
jgi:hypothetical protein